MHLYVKYQQLCAAKGVDETEAYKEMGLNKGTVSVWRTDCAKGKESGLSMTTAEKMAEYFGVSIAFFSSKCNSIEEAGYLLPDDITAEDIAWLRRYKALKGPFKEAVRNVIEANEVK